MSVSNTQMVGGAGKAHPRKEKANVEMLAISKSGQKVDWCLLPIFATLYRVKKFFKNMLEEKAISCYDCSTKAYFLPDETESNYKNTENSLKS